MSLSNSMIEIKPQRLAKKLFLASLGGSALPWKHGIRWPARCLIAIILFACVWNGRLLAQQDTLYMSVLNSRKHRLGALDNPTVGLFVSTDAGTTWKHRGWTGYIRTFYTEAGSDGMIWSACGNGVFRSSDHGATWRITTGWEITEVLKVKVDPLKPSVVYAATAYGVFKTQDNGESWKEQNVGFLKPFVSDIVIDRTNTRRILAASEDGVYMSTNAGAGWKLTGLRGKGVRTLRQHPSHSKTFFAGTEDDGLFLSSDGGKTWRQSNAGLTQMTVYTIACDRSNANVIYLGTHGGGVYRSADGGKSWKQMIQGLDNLVVHSLLLPSDPSVVFAGTLNGGLFKSTDRGEHWTFNSQEEGQVWGLWVR
jgi:photosystem II stability/assembly factor-like uncharacterized protein